MADKFCPKCGKTNVEVLRDSWGKSYEYFSSDGLLKTGRKYKNSNKCKDCGKEWQ